MERSIVVGLITFLLGLFLGHRLSLGRDRRQEFNEITKSAYLHLCAQIKNRTLDRTHIPIPLIETHISFFRRSSFRNSAQEYENGQYDFGEYNPATGSAPVNEKEVDRFIENARTVLFFLKPR